MSEGAASESRIRHEKVLRAVTDIAGYRRGLVKAVREFADEAVWVGRWVEDERAEDNLIAAVERQFERIVNAWQDDVFDVLEREAAARGMAPKPPTGAEDADRWIEDALVIGLIDASPGPGQAPGRWDRQVLLGFMDRSRPDVLRPFVDVRKLFQHAYTGAADEAKGRYVWATIHALLRAVPAVTGDIESALATLWPDA